MVPNTLNLDPGPENRPNLDPDQDPGPDPKFSYQFCKKKIYKKVREEQLSFKAIFSFNYKEYSVSDPDPHKDMPPRSGSRR